MVVKLVHVDEIIYSRQVWIFNQCFTSAKTGKSIMYMFDETTAKKGANETASFLHHFIQNYIGPDIKKLYLFSDNCARQNKNKLLTMLLTCIAAKNQFEIIQQHFPKHSFLPCERNFEILKRQKDKRNMYTCRNSGISLFNNHKKNQRSLW